MQMPSSLCGAGFNPRTFVKAFLAVSLTVLICARSPAADAPAPWWNSAWHYRSLLELSGKGPAMYRAWLMTGPRAAADGGDIVVVNSSGKPVPCSVVYSTPEGRRLIAFSDEKGSRPAGAYYAYFGSASTQERLPLPDSGLVLKTKMMARGVSVGSWKDAVQAIAAAKTCGADFWHTNEFAQQVFTAYNPFGPQANYISMYEGTIDCPKAGLWRFATISDDASFLLVDGEVVSQWPGRDHNIHQGARGEKGGERKLTAGHHIFRYVGFAFDGPKRMEAAWQPPDADRFHVIPGSAFPAVGIAKVVRTEDAGQGLCAAFDAQMLQYLEAGDARMVAVQFTSQSGGTGSAAPREFLWEFGDGLTSGARDPVHVYVFPGRYDVKLTVGSGAQDKEFFSCKIEAKPLWQDLDFTNPQKQKFWEWTKDYPVEKLATDQLLALKTFLQDIEQPRKTFDVNLELDKRKAQLNAAQFCSVATDLAAYYLEPLHDWKSAEKYYAMVLEKCGKDDVGLRLETRFKLADLHFYYAGDAAKAKAELAALRSDIPKADATRRRMALVRLGDIERDSGKPDDARKLYREAESDPVFLPKEPRAVADGRYSQEVALNLSRGDGETALAKLDQWLWLYPTKRLDGPPFVMRLKADLLQKNYAEARKQAAIALKFMTDLDCIPQVELLFGQSCAAMGDKTEARKHFQTVLDKWPESPAVKDAKQELDRLK